MSKKNKIILSVTAAILVIAITATTTVGLIASKIKQNTTHIDLTSQTIESLLDENSETMSKEEFEKKKETDANLKDLTYESYKELRSVSDLEKKLAEFENDLSEEIIEDEIPLD